VRHFAEMIGYVETWHTVAGSCLEGTPVVGFGDAGEPPFSVDPPLADPTPLVGGPTDDWTRRADCQGEAYWMPWVFEPAAEAEVLVSSTGLGANSAGIVLAGERLLDQQVTTVLPVAGVYHLINPAQMLVTTTTFFEEADALNLEAPGLLRRSVRVLPDRLRISRSNLTSNPQSPSPPSRAGEALSAVADLSSWLNRGRDEIAEICRFSIRSLQYWAAGKEPQAGKVRRLFEVHVLVASLIRARGRSFAREWLEGPSQRGVPRLELLSTEAGLGETLREASQLLFAEPPQGERPMPELPDETYDEVTEPSEAPKASTQTSPRRPRRITPT
jgi:hypothetical protein